MNSPKRNGYRVLVVDDEPDILREFLAALQPDRADALKREELSALESALFGQSETPAPAGICEPVTCRQGDEAVERVRIACMQGFPFALAFVDIHMPPGRDGVEVARRIRALDPLINIVMVTGFSDYHSERIAALIPPQDKILFLKKPLYADEIRQLASALGAKWQAEKGRLEAYANLEELVQSRTRQLQRANTDLARLKRIHRDLYGAVSRELNVPLDMIRREAAAASERAGADPRILLAALDHIGARARQLGNLLEELSGMANAETGTLTADLHRVPLARLLHELSDDLSTLARDQGCRVSIDAPRDGLHVEADPQRLKLLLLLLVGHAIRQAGAGGEVSVSAGPEPSAVIAVISWPAAVGAIAVAESDEPLASGDTGSRPSAQPFCIAGAIVDAHSGQIDLVADGDRRQIRLQMPIVRSSRFKDGSSLH